MNKIEWENTYKILEKCHSDFYHNHRIYKTGKNKKVRSIADRDARSSINLAKLNLERNREVAVFFAKSKFGGLYAQDEFWQFQYFESDMAEFLKIMREEIDKLE